MTELKTAFVPVFLLAQALLVSWTSSFERPPAKPDFSRFPTEIGSWERIREDPVDLATEAQLGADRILSRTYREGNSPQVANLFVAWFQSQRAGTSQPHSPQVCLPATGWVPEATGVMDINTSAGKITVNRYLIAKGTERAVVLYWYQTPRRVIAGEWAAKLWLVADALRDRRTDTSLVRVTTWVEPNSGAAAATQLAAGYARQVYPLLRGTIPR